MKKFNIEEAKAGKEVITKSGHSVRIVCFDAIRSSLVDGTKYPIVALVHKPGFGEVPISYTKDGEIYADFVVDPTEDKDKWNLFMKPITQEGWVNIYYNPTKSVYFASQRIYDSHDDAYANMNSFGMKYITTTKISWEV